MGKSLIWQIDELAQGQVQAFQTVNDMLAAIEDATQRHLAVSSTSDYTLSVINMLRYNSFHWADAAAASDFIVPSEVDTIAPVATERVITLVNDGNYPLRIITDDPGSSVTVSPCSARTVLITGGDVISLYALPPHAVGFFSFGTPGSSDEALRYNFGEAVTYLPNFVGTYGSLAVNPTTFTAETGQIVWAQVADVNDTITVFDGRATTVFTFKASGDGLTGAAVQVTRGATATNSAQNFKAALNANTNINVTGAGAGTTITMTNNVAFHGSITKSDADNDYAVTDFSGGAFYQFDIQNNGVSVGTVAIDGSGNFWFASDSNAAVDFNIGDVLTVVAPASADATAAGIAFTLLGKRA